MRDDDKRRRRKRDKAKRREHLGAKRHVPAAGTIKQQYLAALAAGQKPCLDAGGRDIRLDFSPGVLARVPLEELVELLLDELVPKMDAYWQKNYPGHCLAQHPANHPQAHHGHMDSTAALIGSHDPSYLASLNWWRDCCCAELVACLLDELHGPEPLWRPDLGATLKGYQARLQAQLDAPDDLDDDDDDALDD
jgi:hypothetical protein